MYYMYMGDKQHRAIMRLENTEENVNLTHPFSSLSQGGYPHRTRGINVSASVASLSLTRRSLARK